MIKSSPNQKRREPSYSEFRIPSIKVTCTVRELLKHTMHHILSSFIVSKRENSSNTIINIVRISLTAISLINLKSASLNHNKINLFISNLIKKSSSLKLLATQKRATGYKKFFRQWRIKSHYFNSMSLILIKMESFFRIYPKKSHSKPRKRTKLVPQRIEVKWKNATKYLMEKYLFFLPKKRKIFLQWLLKKVYLLQKSGQ